MIIKLKWVVIAETCVIVILIAALVNSYLGSSKSQEEVPKEGLLSPRIYSGLLEPKSFLITHFAPLKLKIQNYIAKNNLNVSVYVENLRNGVWMGINERTGFFPTSLNKLPVAILVMKKIEDGELSFDTMLEIKDSDRISSSGELYKTKEKELPLRVVLEKLLKESDNTALSILLRQMSLEDLQLVLDYYGIDMNVDLQKQQRKKTPDLINPKAMASLYSSLYFSTVLEPHNSEYLLSLLANTTFPIKEIAGLPDDVRVAHKFGVNYYGTNQYFHDCGIMYINDRRVFYCIMTKGMEAERAVETIGVIVNEIYFYVRDTKARLGAYKEKN
ncbi:MAG: serine hydrolase [Nanoarchaeota archaeon]|nr:serine hydrolase [Nanoarchaeota archaeon]